MCVVCIHMCINVSMWVCLCMWKPMLVWGIFPNYYSLYILKQDLSMNLKFTASTSLSPPVNTGVNGWPACLLSSFTLVLGIWTHVLMLVCQTLYPLSHLLCPLFSFHLFLKRFICIFKNSVYTCVWVYAYWQMCPWRLKEHTRVLGWDLQVVESWLMWGLRTLLGSFAWAICAHNHWAISLVYYSFIFRNEHIDLFQVVRVLFVHVKHQFH